MNTIAQLARPVQHQTSNKLESSMPHNDVRKLLLVHDLLSQRSSGLIEKLQNLESSALEVSGGIDDLFTMVNAIRPDMLILSVEVLAETTLVQLIQIQETCPLPVIVVAKQYTRSVVQTVVSAGVSSYLVDEVSLERLTIIVDLSIARFKQQQSLICELQVTKEKLLERKLIERAKGIIMKQKKLSEEEAYSQMRKSAMNQGQSMADLAKRIISVFELLE